MAGRLARPPYVDPNTNIIYDTDNPEYAGFLTKQSMWLKVTRRRTAAVVVFAEGFSASERCAMIVPSHAFPFALPSSLHCRTGVVDIFC